jgi:N-acetylglucosamine-6-phosphate deacetylase
VAQRVAGIHVEGPYISVEEGPRGAHPLEHCRPPDWEEFNRLQEAAGGRIRLLTMSPEYDGSPQFIEKVVGSGVVVAIGHTQADSGQIAAAIDAGARLSTHLGNGAHGLLRRHPNYIWDQLADDRISASLILDGHHLPPSVAKCFVRAKGMRRCLLISDLVALAGLPAGTYDDRSMGPVEVLEDGRLVVAGQRQYLAGASLPITLGVANAMRFADLSLREAVDMASTQPCALMGGSVVCIEPDAPAELVLFDLPADDRGPIHVRATINAGELVFGQLE